MQTTTKLRRLRRERGISQARLGAALGGLDRSAVSLLESGQRRSRPVTARALELIFGAPVDELLAPENANGDGPKTAAD